MTGQTGELPLDRAGIGAYLRGLGLVGEVRGVAEVTGGVSSSVLRVDMGDERLIVKQALPALRVREEWLASPHRASTEAAVLRQVAVATPEAVPGVVAADDGAIPATRRLSAGWPTSSSRGGTAWFTATSPEEHPRQPVWVAPALGP